MKLGLLLHDPEEEHDCFSDNAHNSHYYDAQGIQNVYLGRYARIDGSVVEGASLAALVAASDPALDAEMRAKLEATADGQEWRTPPLWGIGLTETVSGHTLFLHDGRARNLTEAVLWHGGEAQAARDSFAGLPTADRDALIAFLESL